MYFLEYLANDKSLEASYIKENFFYVLKSHVTMKKKFEFKSKFL